ncbi:hypothetical protein Hanom_Chr03g00265231 [Helianthus anomalus]
MQDGGGPRRSIERNLSNNGLGRLLVKISATWRSMEMNLLSSRPEVTNFHMLATTAVDANLNQIAEPPLLPLFPDQPMLELNQANQFPIPAFDPNELPRIPTPQPLQYHPWFDDNRSYLTLYPLEEPMPLERDPWHDNDRTFFKMNSANPYKEPVPPPEPLDPPMSQKQL